MFKIRIDCFTDNIKTKLYKNIIAPILVHMLSNKYRKIK